MTKNFSKSIKAKLLPYPVLIRDLPVPDILAYSLKTVVAEKFHAMLDCKHQPNCRRLRMSDPYIAGKRIYSLVI